MNLSELFNGTPKHFSEFLAAFSATLFLFSTAVGFGWSSPSLPKLLSSDSPVPITPDEASWIAACVKIGSIAAAINAAWMMDRFGRKVSLLVGAMPLIIGFILIGVAKSVVVIYVARILCGFSFGLAYTVTPMYLGEIASDSIRGGILVMLTVMAKSGILYAYSIGPYVSVQTMAWLGLIPPIVFIAAFSWQPESPYYYLGKNRKDDAFKSLAKLRGHENILDEFDRMDAAVRRSQENKGMLSELFLIRGNRKGLITILGLCGLSQLCGGQAIIVYAEMIFDKIGGTLRGSEATIVLGITQLASAVITLFTVDVIGRRPLVLVSIIGTAVCCTIIGIYFNLGRYGIDCSGMAWVAVLTMMVYMIFYTIGIAAVSFAILGEIFPKNLKAFAAATFSITGGILAFIIMKLFQMASDGLGYDYTFFGFAMFSFSFFPFVWFLLPETKGKSLDAILEELNEPRRYPNIPRST